MLSKAKELIGRTVRATDGDIGSVTNVYFDDDRWTVRYLVVDTGKWLPAREVLISPFAIRQTRFAGPLEVSLTREQVKNSPDVNTERPVSRQQESAYSDYYGYPYYWAGPSVWGAATVPMWPSVPPADDIRATAAARGALHAHDERNSHLRDVKQVSGYHIQAADGSVGHVDDFLLDHESWTIRYLIVDTSNWIGGRHVLIAPRWVSAIRWGTSRIEVAMTRDAVRGSPEYDRTAPVQRSYEDRLHAHYAQRPYWTDNRSEVADADRDTGHARVTRLEQLPDLEVADRDTDVRNWRVVAADGVAVGRVEHLIVDRTAMKVRYLEIGLDVRGGAASAARDVLVPLEYVDLDKPAKQVWLRGIHSSRVADLPPFTGLPIDPQLVSETRSHFARRLQDGDREPAVHAGPPATPKRRA